MRWLLTFLFLAVTGPAWAQNPTCPTRPLGDDSNACASTAFVANAIGGGGTVTITEGVTATSGFTNTYLLQSSGSVVTQVNPSTFVPAASENIYGGWASYGSQTLHSTWFNEPAPGPGLVAQIDRITDRLFLGAAALNSGDYYPSGGCPGDCNNNSPALDWWAINSFNAPAGTIGYDGDYSQVFILADPNSYLANLATPLIGLTVAIEDPQGIANATPRAVESMAFNDPTADTKPSMWAYYSEAHTFANAGETFTMELEPTNQCCTASVWSPYSTPANASGGPTIGIGMGCGAGEAPSYNCEVGMYFTANPQEFETGILFLAGSLDETGGDGLAIALQYNYAVAWFTSDGKTANIESTTAGDLVFSADGVYTFPNVSTGTPATFACFDASFHLIRSATACAS